MTKGSVSTGIKKDLPTSETIPILDKEIQKGVNI
jgi:hypothetical protein